jgi:hypothetical protein
LTPKPADDTVAAEVDMASATTRASLSKVGALINKLPTADKVRLVQRLERQTWELRFNSLIKRIREQTKARPISDMEIQRICETVRQRRYDQGRR